MKAKSDTKETFAIVEHLPWLSSPRTLVEFESYEEALKELHRLEGLITSGSTFCLSKGLSKELKKESDSSTEFYELNWYLIDLINRGYS